MHNILCSCSKLVQSKCKMNHFWWHIWSSGFSSLRTSRLLGCHLLYFNKHWVPIKWLKVHATFVGGWQTHCISSNAETLKFFLTALWQTTTQRNSAANISMQNKALFFGGSANNLEAPRVGSSFLFSLYFLLLEGHYSKTVVFTVGPKVVCLRESCL